MTVSNSYCISPHKIEENAGVQNPQYLRAYQLPPRLLSLGEVPDELKGPEDRGPCYISTGLGISAVV
jgi:hypothetical protein